MGGRGRCGVWGSRGRRGGRFLLGLVVVLVALFGLDGGRKWVDEDLEELMGFVLEVEG